MLLGMLLVLATLLFVGGLLYGAYREARKEWRSESWNHRGAA
ncbi:MAG TPA: hypothetical protein VE825_14120 [Terriglobales bacterium]|jgi:hypothetical protein|nr:hypothetical protein [Terriglobales bacterium]